MKIIDAFKIIEYMCVYIYIYICINFENSILLIIRKIFYSKINH